MKKIIANIVTGLLVCLLSSCNDFLDEENRSNLGPDYFSTPQGVRDGLTAAYAGLRNFYGPEEGLEAFTVAGTDEFAMARSGARVKDIANYTTSYTSTNEVSKYIWNNAYRWINTCNGLVDYGTDMTGLSDTEKKGLLAEARFLRAFYYFNLVQLFGDVTLNKNFYNSPSTSAERNSAADVYDFIIEDLKVAATDLPASPSAVDPGKASGATAKHLLAKVYLTRGYKSYAHADDFKNALEVASGLIGEASSIGLALLDDYADVFKTGNENNAEVLLSVQYSSDKTFGSSHPMNHVFVGGYHLQLKDRTMEYGRPYVWYRPTKWVVNTAFADKVNDTRYYKTFQSVWYAIKDTKESYTLKDGDYTITTDVDIHVGDTALYMPGYEMTEDEIKAKKYFVFTPRFYDDATYPTMTKFLDPVNRVAVNDNSYRPIMVYRFAETYLIAAEAAFKMGGKNDVAAGFINEIRKRAAAEGKESLVEITENDIDMNFILAERSRELCGEITRWLDLVRTGTLVERVKAYEPISAAANIKDKHILRPIPQSQIDLVITGKPYPQNPEW